MCINIFYLLIYNHIADTVRRVTLPQTKTMLILSMASLYDKRIRFCYHVQPLVMLPSL